MSQNHAWFKKHPWIKHFNMTEYENKSIGFQISYCKKPLRNYTWWILGYYPKTVPTKIRKWKWKSLSHVWLFEVSWNVVCGILQARIQEWVTFPFSVGSSQLRDRRLVSCIAVRFFTNRATREAHKNQKEL